jgi:hypothetical protein
MIRIVREIIAIVETIEEKVAKSNIIKEKI